MSVVSASPTSSKLNFGCGRKPRQGWVNLDIVPLEGVDVIHDIFSFPYPFPDCSFEYILCSHVLEHVPQIVHGKDGLLSVIAELHRILEPGGKIEVRGPHPRIGIYYFNNPTHYRVITQWTFEGLVRKDPAHFVHYVTGCRFSKMEVRDETFTDPPFNSGLLESLMHRVPLAKRLLGRPAELVIYLTK